ncbi:hypothetical protein DEIGR_400053 [Deinococcus grandis]|uniref:Uncharacterized protein n=1 Tax=Deinococcus grandis TaxID=57498 RepID=A0A100HNE2_9DEIO|nr:hypothetical protein [Deinococcus grandis]GAQ23920.1 hypothetical protein DEIGR_400053 [Deinococcus grandis]
MKAKVTGKSAWQGVPDDGYLNIHIIGDRWADAHGNATVSRYSGRLNPGKTGFGDAKNPAADLYIPVQGPGDPDGPLARFEEILVYGGETVRSEYTRRLIATDLDGLIFDYAAPEPTSLPPSFGQAPLTIQAAQQLLDTGTAKIAQVDQKLIQVDDSLADIAQHLLENTVYASDSADDPPLPDPYRPGVRGRKLTASGNVLYLVTAPAETPGWLPTQELLSGDAVAAVEAAAADARVAAGEATAAIGGLSGYRLVDALDGLTDRRGRRVVAGYADELGQSPQHITEDGRTWMHGAAVGDMDVQQGEPGSGIAWALTDRDERMAAWVTDAGEFGAASLTAALRSGRYTVCVCDGDSMTQGLGSSHFAFTANAVAYPGGGYPYVLQQHLGGAVQVVNRGSCSAQAYDIAARTYGGGGVAAQYGVGAPVGGTYPLTGLNNRSPLLTPNGGTLSQRGRLGEVLGTLTRDNRAADWQSNRTAYYTFTPDPGEPTLETSATPAAPRRIYTWHPDLAHTDQPHIIWAGRNNVGDHAQTVESVRAMLSALAPDVPRLVIGVLASQTETWGNGREVVEEINRQLAELAGPAFFDPNEVLGRNADGTLRLDGTPNPAWMSDTLHCNDAGYQRLADALYARIVREGWYD